MDVESKETLDAFADHFMEKLGEKGETLIASFWGGLELALPQIKAAATTFIDETLSKLNGWTLTLEKKI